MSEPTPIVVKMIPQEIFHILRRVVMLPEKADKNGNFE